MKYLIVLSVLFAACSALPAEFADRANVTRNERQIGFSTFGGVTYGGQGGNVWTVWDPWALQNAIAGDVARIIYIRGRIDLTLIFTGSPGIRLMIGSFKSVIGGDANAEITGGGFYLRNNVRQHIFENIKFTNPISYAPGEVPNGNGGIISQIPGAWSTVDSITMDGNVNVWVNHCEFSDDPWISANVPENQRRHNTLIGMKLGVTSVTISNSIFRNHFFCILIGADEGHGNTDSGRLKTTLYGNWFRGCNQRNPFVRFGEVHVFNNLYTDIPEFGVGVGIGASVYVERNVFINVRRALAGGVGSILNVDNWMVNSGQDNGIPTNVNWNPSNYYWYSPLATGNVEWSVRNNAGTWW